MTPMPEPTEHTQPLLRIQDLTVSFPGEPGGQRRNAVKGVALELLPGKTTAVVGESGSGKSVTALSILRLLRSPPARYESGRIDYTTRNGPRVDLLSIAEKPLRATRGDEITMIFQEPMTSLNPVLNIGSQIIEAIRLHRDVTKRRAVEIAVEALRQVDIRDPQARLWAYPHEFSGGMRQRVMIAIALACQPRLLIADEPTTALDVTIQAQILDLIRSLKDEHTLSVMLITHDLGLVANHADNVVVMFAGRVVETGPADAVISRPRHPYTKGLLASAPSVGENRRRLHTLDDLTRDAQQFQIEIDGRRAEAWWPTRQGHPDEAGSPGEIMQLVGLNHHVRIWNA